MSLSKMPSSKTPSFPEAEQEENNSSIHEEK